MALSSDDGKSSINCALGALVYWWPREMERREKISVMFRPEAVAVHRERHNGMENQFAGTVTRTMFAGGHSRCEIEVAGVTIRAEMPSWAEVTPGQSVYVEIPAARIQVLSV